MADETPPTPAGVPEEAARQTAETATAEAATAETAPGETATATAAAGEETTPAQTEEPLFEPEELQQFDADDVQAGSAICKMLSLFFFYTVIVMAVAGYWTYTTLFR